MKRLRPILLTGLLLTFCLSANIHAADGTPLWTNVFNGAGNGQDIPNSLAVDSSGNVYVTGYSFGGGSGYNYATIKYSSAGVSLWTNLFNDAGNGDDFAKSLAVDSSGNVYVTGYSYNSSGNNYDYATIKYSSAGAQLWTNLFNGIGNGDDRANSLAVDANGNVYVTGSSWGGGSSYDYATIKYSSAGVPLWTNLFNGAGNSGDVANSLAVDGDGNVYVTGSGSRSDYATIKYSNAGVPLWTNLYNGSGNGNGQAYSLAVDSDGNVCVTGYSRGSGSFDYATIKYSSAGVPVWTNRYNGAKNYNDMAHTVAVDGGGNVYVTGYTTATNGYSDYATIKYSSMGVPVWTNLINGAGNDNDDATSLVVDSSGNVYVTGYSWGNGSSYDYATIKYSSEGVPLWTNLFNGAANSQDMAAFLAVDGCGNVYVTGYSYNGSANNYDYTTIKYSGPPTPFKFVTTGGNPGFTNQQFRLTLTGPADSNAVISASTNLQDWNSLTTNPLVSGTLTYTDTLATNFILRFYRANLQ